MSVPAENWFSYQDLAPGPMFTVDADGVWHSNLESDGPCGGVPQPEPEIGD